MTRNSAHKTPMHRTAIVIPALLWAVSPQTARAQLPIQFDVDAAHSSIGFSIGFMGLSTVRGAFATFAGTIMYAPNAPERSSVSMLIVARSISTNNATRDQHLKTADFFDVAKYPYITFTSTAVRRTDAGLVVDGLFTMHGTTRSLTIPFAVLNAPVSDAWGNQRMTLSAKLALSRKEYGILGTAFWNGEFDPGRMAVSDSADIDLLVSATTPNVDRWVDQTGDSLLASMERDGFDAAMSRLRTASPTVLDSLSEFTLVLVGEKLATRRHVLEAARFYSYASELRPRSSQLMLWTATAYVRAGDLPRASSLFSKAREMDSLSTVAREWTRVLGRQANP